ncbi:diguanylate cyclase domain-containing protein [Sphingomonas sp. MMS24-J13]|uniref:diguanylate cyclase domain-containing protein n=1 Tax=Sphingomonas sp. MMS24-J13 TaxID=3238686 RepID=UPI00384B3FAC
MRLPSASVPDGTYVELVRSLFRTLPPTILITLIFSALALLITRETPDPLLDLLGIFGTVAAAARITLLLLLRRRAADDTLGIAEARRMERQFALSYLGFAAIIGSFGARAFMVAAPDARIAVTALLVGYAAGVATGISYRPWIGVSAMLMGVVPTIAVTLATPGIDYRAAGCVLLILLAGGIHSIIGRYHYATAGITMRRAFAALARKDGLTGLPNRLALGERFDEISSRKGIRGDIAVHCLDLDRFKPVNDRYGHPTGDLLLQAVAERLGRLLRNHDFAARVGGDEFVVLQPGIGDVSEANLFARRTARLIAEPYVIGDLTIIIGTSIGFALASQHGMDLEKLIAAADAALLRAKDLGGGATVAAAPVRRAG